jgi:hypothetical protein
VERGGKLTNGDLPASNASQRADNAPHHPVQKGVRLNRVQEGLPLRVKRAHRLNLRA